MTNASSEYLSIVVGAIIGGIISWLIYSRQKHTSNQQDHTLESIKKLNEFQDNTLKSIERIDVNHEKMLERLNDSDKRHDKVLSTIVDLGKRIEYLVERQDTLQKSLKSSGAIIEPTSQILSDESEESLHSDKKGKN